MHGHDHHHHGHGHGHSHHHAPRGVDAGTRLMISIVLTLAFVVGEAAAGYYSHSLALLSDAGHNFADALALIFSWYAVWVARKPADSQRTYGHHRWSILAALVNAVSLVLIALVIFWEAFQRFQAPTAVHSGLMIGVAVVALVLNGLISIALRRDAHHDLNMRSAYLHMLGDAVSAVGVVLAGIAIQLTGSPLADPLVSFLIGALILWSSWSILVDSVNVLLEHAPKGLDMSAVKARIGEVDGVLSVHDLHVWTVASGIVACSCHIQVSEQSVRSGQQVLARVVEMLRERFGISHTTVQIEVEGCEPNDMFCAIRKLDDPRHHSH